MDLSVTADKLLSATGIRRGADEHGSDPEAETPCRAEPSTAQVLTQTVEAHLKQAMKLVTLPQAAAKVAGSLPILEEVTYEQQAEAFLRWATNEKLRPVEAGEIDQSLAVCTNAMFFQGHQDWRGQKLLASITFLDGTLGRHGDQKIPRAWRALKGWMLTTPPRSRLPQPWMLMQRGSLIPPVHGVSLFWCLLLYRTEDASIALNTPALQPRFSVVAQVLKEVRESDFIWPFSYHEFSREFARSVRRVGIEHSVVPYMARHSGPSIDRMSGVRDLLEIQKRGRWLQFKSVQRYEKAARLAEVTNSLSAVSVAYMKTAEAHLEAVLLHRSKPMGPPPRP